MTVVSEDDLQSHADGVLPDARRADVDAYLDERPDEAERLRAYREQNAALRTLYAPVLTEPVPSAMQKRLWTKSWRGQAIAASLLVVGIGIGWMARGALPSLRQPAPSFAHAAAIAHAVYAPEVRHPVEVGADQEDHLVRWLSKRLGVELHAPKLGVLGFELVGGRLLSGQQGPVAQFMYQDTKGQRLTLYVSAQKGEGHDTAFRFSQEGRVAVFYWIEDNCGYALSGEIRRDALLAVANAVYKQLNP